MTWQIKKGDKFDIFIPLNFSENKLLDSLSKLDILSNKIIDFSSIPLSKKILNVLKTLLCSHQSSNKSFVVIVKLNPKKIDLNEIIVHVGTLSEAIDYIYMEELERNL